MRLLLEMAKENNKHVYVMTPDVIYGNQQPGRLTVYNNDENIANSYKELVSILKKYPIIWKIIHNWCMYKKEGRLTEQAFKYVDNVDWEEFKNEVTNNTMIMTPADISASIMYLDLLRGNIDNFYTFDHYSDLILNSENKIKYIQSENDNTFHMCTKSSNENFANNIQNFVNNINL